MLSCKHFLRGVFPLAVLPLALALGVLGSGPAAASAAPNPCGVLKVSEIKRVLGGHVARGSRNADLCGWDTNGGLGRGGGELQVTLDQGPDAVQNYDGFAQDQTNLTGIGDKAFYDPTLGLNVVKGPSYLVLTSTASTLGRQPRDAAVRAKLIKLAAVALPRI